MKAYYRTAEGHEGNFEYPVIIPQESEHGGFTLVGFDDFEMVSEGKMSGAITGLLEFRLDHARKIGFGNR